MAVMVDLEKAKEMIKFYIMNGETKNFILSELDKLAYGKIYTCWNCGEKIYAGDGAWYHVVHKSMLCKGPNDGIGVLASENIATPKPKDMED